MNLLAFFEDDDDTSFSGSPEDSKVINLNGHEFLKEIAFPSHIILNKEESISTREDLLKLFSFPLEESLIRMAIVQTETHQAKNLIAQLLTQDVDLFLLNIEGERPFQVLESYIEECLNTGHMIIDLRAPKSIFKINE